MFTTPRLGYLWSKTEFVSGEREPNSRPLKPYWSRLVSIANRFSQSTEFSLGQICMHKVITLMIVMVLVWGLIKKQTKRRKQTENNICRNRLAVKEQTQQTEQVNKQTDATPFSATKSTPWQTNANGPGISRKPHRRELQRCNSVMSMFSMLFTG